MGKIPASFATTNLEQHELQYCLEVPAGRVPVPGHGSSASRRLCVVIQCAGRPIMPADGASRL